jgi:hypothetical protein
MSTSQAGFVTKSGNLSAKALKRVFKDGGVLKKSTKKQIVLEAEPDEVYEEPLKEIPDLGFPKTSVPLRSRTGLERLDSYLSDSLASVFNLTFIGKRLAKVSTQDTVYSRQIPIYLESYIPIYTYRYVGI